MLPLSIWSWQDTVKAVLGGKASVVEVYPDVVVRAVSINMPVPSVIALREYAPTGKAVSNWLPFKWLHEHELTCCFIIIIWAIEACIYEAKCVFAWWIQVPVLLWAVSYIRAIAWSRWTTMLRWKAHLVRLCRYFAIYVMSWSLLLQSYYFFANLFHYLQKGKHRDILSQM